MNGYLCFYSGKKIEVRAETSYAAQKEAARILRVKPNKEYMITVVLCEKETPNGTEEIIHVPDF